MIKDPIEQTSEYQNISNEVDEETNKILSEQSIPKTRGYINKFWALKKQILKNKHNLNWKTPAEMNPGILFD